MPGLKSVGRARDILNLRRKLAGLFGEELKKQSVDALIGCATRLGQEGVNKLDAKARRKQSLRRLSTESTATQLSGYGAAAGTLNTNGLPVTSPSGAGVASGALEGPLDLDSDGSEEDDSEDEKELKAQQAKLDAGKQRDSLGSVQLVDLDM